LGQKEAGIMKVIKNECLQEAYIGQKIAAGLAIDYDENQQYRQDE